MDPSHTSLSKLTTSTCTVIKIQATSLSISGSAMTKLQLQNLRSPISQQKKKKTQVANERNAYHHLLARSRSSPTTYTHHPRERKKKMTYAIKLSAPAQNADPHQRASKKLPNLSNSLIQEERWKVVLTQTRTYVGLSTYT